MIIIDYDTAVEIVKSLYNSAKDPLLNVELELTKGERNYRPYLTAAKLMLTEYRRISKAEEVTFEYTDNIKALLENQRALDSQDTIPEGQTIDYYLQNLFPNDESVSSSLGIMLI